MKSLSPIRQKYDVPQPGWPGVSQAFYRLEKTDEYLIIDLAVLKMTAHEKFLAPEIHGNNIFYFNKNNAAQSPTFDVDSFASKAFERAVRLKARMDMFGNFVQKELNRNHFAEALDLYNGLILASLVETLRIMYNPVHREFKMHHIYDELPRETVRRLEPLFSVLDERDLEAKSRKAVAWFCRVVAALNQEVIKKRILENGRRIQRRQI